MTPTLDSVLQSAERDYLHKLMLQTNWKVKDAAKIAGRNRCHLYRILRKHGLIR